MLHADDTITPYEIVAKKKPSLLSFHVFGARRYVYDHLFQKDLSERSIVGYHLGEAPDSKGWLFWVPNTRKIITGASVKFNEQCFWRKNSAFVPSAMLIQVSNIFDNSMIKNIDGQDKSVDSINVSYDPLNATPIRYKIAIVSAEANDWSMAINSELDSMKA
ncbi:hypothetical protein O181_012890 [Austropuccinia psidii MF-1]|uniref:Retroviral polymerase SH3-like domain-containing protein n=1 Tax=Austropuccinia psidii MF-1 TaxID=1389203 RepID=A0A9Q3BYT8_9BASI|nr:hypothetical protein [Austropuccinia psidii MF-1]